MTAGKAITDALFGISGTHYKTGTRHKGRMHQSITTGLLDDDGELAEGDKQMLIERVQDAEWHIQACGIHLK